MPDREFIIAEIRRLTKENDGVPIGQTRFAKETGIRESEWLGRYWARWGDALTDAGFVPNTFTQALDEDFILAKYIGVIRSLGRIPTRAELQLASKDDPDFPSLGPFKRLGTKCELINLVAEYCRKQEGFGDVLGIVESPANQKRGKSKFETTVERELGFVYLMRSGRYFKIGRSNAAGRREREIALQLPEKANTVHVIRTDDPPGIEAYWHKRFESKRKNGEWFELDREGVSVFKRRKFM
jgi:hypothetical protein